MAEALDEADKPPICVEPRLLKRCLRSIGVKQKLVTTICKTFSHQKLSHKTTAELPKHVHFRISLDNPLSVKRPSPFKSLILNPPMYQDLTLQTNYFTKL